MTINTGCVRESCRSEVADDAIEMMRPYCQPGIHQLPAGPNWAMRVTAGETVGLFFAVCWCEEPVVTCGVARDDAGADELWPVIERLYLDITDRAPFNAADWESPQRPGRADN